MRSTEEIVRLFRHRQFERGPFFEKCREISQHYDGEIALPLPEIGEKERPAVANLIGQGIDQHALRVASVLPDVQCPPLKPGDSPSEKRASQRRRSCIGWWEINAYELMQKQRARWLVAFAQAPVRLVPDKKSRQPKWVTRTPLETYPGDVDFPDMQPADCIFAVQRTVGWLKRAYPEVPLTGLQVPGGSKFSGTKYLTDTDLVDVLEYIDGDSFTVLALGCGHDPTGLIYQAEYGIQDARIVNLGPVGGDSGPKMWAAPLLTGVNRLGECPVVIPGRISLGGLKGQFDDTIGLYQMQAKLMAMEVNAVANGIWPDQWLVGPDNATPKIITPADGRKGVVGVAQGGTFVNQQIQPGLQTPTTIDRLERGIRQNAGIPADFGGESASNIRTGRRGAAVLSAAVDYIIQEHQQILARSAQTELQIAAGIDLAYFRNTKKSFYVSWKGGKGRLDYTPKDIWSEDRTVRVNYAKAGADVNALDVEIGQLKSMEVISSLTAGRMHPDVADPEFEADQILYEMLRAGLVQQFPGQLAQGAMALDDYIRVMQLVRQDKMTIEDAYAKAQKEAQARQATPAPSGAPETMPGMNPPGAGAEQGMATIPALPPSVDNLTQALRAARTAGQISQAGAPQ